MRMVTATNVTFLTVAIYLLDLAIKIVALGLVPEGRRPSSATAWLLLILFLPVIGLLAFWLIGSPFVDRGRRRQQAAAGEVISGALTAETNDLLPVPAGSTLNTLVVLNRRLGWLPSVGGNKAVATWYIETNEVLRENVRPNPYEVEPGDVVCQVVPSGPGFPDENNLRLFNSLIYSAQRRLSITSPYFVPDDSLLYAITTAAQRGVDVELFVGEQGDQFMVHHAQRSYYQALLRAGVKIYLYPAPLVLHSKHFSVDDDVAVIGSSNMDIRSFNLDFEVSVMCVSRSLTTAMRQVEDRYRLLSRELTLDEWARRPLRKRYLDNVMRLTSALQ